MDEGLEERPERPPTRVRATSPIDAQRRPVTLTRAMAMWRGSLLTGVLAIVTAALWREDRRSELVESLGPSISTGDAEQAVTILVVGTFAALGVLLITAALLVGRLPAGGVFSRLLLTLVAVVQAGFVSVAAPILTTWQWEGFVTTGLLVLQAALGALGAVLMWLPGPRPR